MRTRSDVGAVGPYVDASALAKLILEEPGSHAMCDLWTQTRLTSSALAVTEVLRAVRRLHPHLTDAAVERLDHVYTVPVDDDVLMAAGLVAPPALRSLDAIQLATALALHPHVSPLITYDDRLAAAARAAGLAVASPR